MPTWNKRVIKSDSENDYQVWKNGYKVAKRRVSFFLQKKRTKQLTSLRLGRIHTHLRTWPP